MVYGGLGSEYRKDLNSEAAFSPLPSFLRLSRPLFSFSLFSWNWNEGNYLEQVSLLHFHATIIIQEIWVK